LALLPAEIAILIIEHDMDIVFRFASHITVLDQGRVIAHGSAQEVAANDLVQSVYFGNSPGHTHA
jgi:ABC-type branched-subunit amino acid transport system ATPase component